MQSSHADAPQPAAPAATPRATLPRASVATVVSSSITVPRSPCWPRPQAARWMPAKTSMAPAQADRRRMLRRCDLQGGAGGGNGGLPAWCVQNHAGGASAARWLANKAAQKQTSGSDSRNGGQRSLPGALLRNNGGAAAAQQHAAALARQRGQHFASPARWASTERSPSSGEGKLLSRESREEPKSSPRDSLTSPRKMGAAPVRAPNRTCGRRWPLRQSQREGERAGAGEAAFSA